MIMIASDSSVDIGSNFLRFGFVFLHFAEIICQHCSQFLRQAEDNQNAICPVGLQFQSDRNLRKRSILAVCNF